MAHLNWNVAFDFGPELSCEEEGNYCPRCAIELMREHFLENPGLPCLVELDLAPLGGDEDAEDPQADWHCDKCQQTITDSPLPERSSNAIVYRVQQPDEYRRDWNGSEPATEVCEFWCDKCAAERLNAHAEKVLAEAPKQFSLTTFVEGVTHHKCDSCGEL